MKLGDVLFKPLCCQPSPKPPGDERHCISDGVSNGCLIQDLSTGSSVLRLHNCAAAKSGEIPAVLWTADPMQSEPQGGGEPALSERAEMAGREQRKNAYHEYISLPVPRLGRRFPLPLEVGFLQCCEEEYLWRLTREDEMIFIYDA